MSLRDLVQRTGSFKALFDDLKASGANVEKQAQQAFENDSVFKYVGFRIEKIEEGVVQISFPFSERITRWGGIVHGGIVAMALDNRLRTGRNDRQLWKEPGYDGVGG